ncbi:MAG: hypothetical protein JWO36_3282 [Myxococcales bacterium]|nr:hypothetical protein [Myxococcales bacterium]
MIKRLLVGAVVCGSSFALAQPAPVPSAPPSFPPTSSPATVPAEIEHGGPPQTGFQIQGRMSTNLGLTDIVTPGFSMGYRTGNMVISAELGLIVGSLTSGTLTDSVYLIHLMPAISFDVWQSDDGRARMNVIGGIGIGQGKLKSERTDPMNPSISESTATYLPVLAGIGGDYYLHKNFALGVEAGAELPFLLSVSNNGTDQNVKGGIQSLHGLLRVTFITGR